MRLRCCTILGATAPYPGGATHKNIFSHQQRSATHAYNKGRNPHPQQTRVSTRLSPARNSNYSPKHRRAMGRPQPSIRNKQLTLLFANSVTVPSSRVIPFADTVGRTDEHSLFNVFSQVCPSATKDQHQRGDGMSLA
eukprot:3689999-Rhodomonas_salina.1